jgi:putative endonuclease
MENKPRETLYIGITNNLVRRVYEHRNGLIDGFTKNTILNYLFILKSISMSTMLFKEEKTLKRWQRKWKIKRIEESNSYWKDLYETLWV